MNRLEIFNEVCILAAAYHLLLFTDYIESPEFQYKIGWSIIGITTFNIVVNMIVMCEASFQMAKLALRRIYHKHGHKLLKRVKKGESKDLKGQDATPDELIKGGEQQSDFENQNIPINKK